MGVRVQRQSNQSWIKLHTEMLYDPKLLRLHPIGRFAWIGLLLMARAGDPPGTWQARSREAVPEDLACVLRLDDALDDGVMMGHVASAVVEWERSRMVAIGDDGLVTVTNWDKRQGDLRPSSHPEAVRARVRKHRASQDVTQCNAVKRGVTTEERRVEEIRVEKPQPMRSARARRTAASDDPAFEAFWTAYPDSRRRGKFEAAAAWRELRLSPAQVTQVMASLEAWKRTHDWAKESGKFVPWPQKFLRKRRWEETPNPESRYESGDLAPLRLST